MTLKLGSTTINKMYIGSTEVSKAYLGSTLVFDNSGGGYTPSDPDAAAYITAVETADGQPMSDFMKEAVDDFYIKLKADGNFGADLELHIFGIAQTLNGGLIAQKGTNAVGVGLTPGDYSRTAGIVGNGTNKGITVDTSKTFASYNDDCFYGAAFTKGSGEEGAGFWARGNSSSTITLAYIREGGGNARIYHVGAANRDLSAMTNDVEYIGASKQTSGTGGNFKDNVVGASTYSISSLAVSPTGNVKMGIQCRTLDGVINNYDSGSTRFAAWGYASEQGTPADFYDAIFNLLSAIDTDAA